MAPGAIALINEQLQALLVGHGHPTGTVKAQANSLIDKFGQKRCRQILESKAAWPTLKHEASAAGIVLIPSDSRSSKEIKRDLVFDEDPWARYNSPRGNKEKTVETKRRPRKQGQAARVDLSFFTQVNNLFHKSTLLNSFKVGQVCMWSDLKILPILTLSPPQICALAHQLCWLLVLLEKVFRNVSLTRLNPC